MNIAGIIKDAAGEIPLHGAKIKFLVGDKELACLYSGSDGRFNHKENSSYIGEILVCEVQKKAYHPQKVTYNIEEENIDLDIELIALEKEKNEPPIEKAVILSKKKEEPTPPIKKKRGLYWKIPIFGFIGYVIGGLIFEYKEHEWDLDDTSHLLLVMGFVLVGVVLALVYEIPSNRHYPGNKK